MTSRILPPEEWSRITGTQADAAPLGSAAVHGGVIVVERDGAIVGTCLVSTCVHVDGLWVHPDDRGRVGVQRELLRRAVEAIRALGGSGAVVSAVSAPMQRWIQAADGTLEIPGRSYVMSLRGLHG